MIAWREGGRERQKEQLPEVLYAKAKNLCQKIDKTGQTCFSNLLGAIEDSSIVPELWAGANDSSCYGYYETKSNFRPRRPGLL